MKVRDIFKSKEYKRFICRMHYQRKRRNKHKCYLRKKHIDVFTLFKGSII